MTAPPIDPPQADKPPTVSPQPGRTGVLAILAAGLVLLLVLFHAEAVAAVRVWIESTAYNHGFLVIPIALWLAWDRRARLAACPIRPAPRLALLALPLLLMWLLAERLGIMEGRQLAVIGFVEVLFLAVLGLRMAKAAAGPLLYLVFLVPFGAFLTTALQDFTVGFVVRGLDLLGIPNFSNGYIIEIPEGVFFVAQACAGLRFLIASVAFGALYALMMYRSPWRRAGFLLASIIVPIIANGFRALGIVALGHILGSARAAATDHVLYGWLFFSIVILLLVVGGLPFRQDGTERVAPMAPPFLAPARGAALGAVVLALAIAAIGPTLAQFLDHGATVAPLAQLPDLPGPSFCAADTPVQATHPGRLTLTRSYDCAGTRFALRVDLFAPRSGPGRVLRRQRNAILYPGAEDIESHALGHDGAFSLVTTSHPTSATVSGLWIDGRAASGALRTRMLQAANSLLGGGPRPVVATLTITQGASPSDGGAALLRGFIVQSPHLAAAIAGLSHAP
ncbi:MAG: exosortase [Rhodospirillales bacterium]|nr:exosortase [Rhodospirillales bacterium]